MSGVQADPMAFELLDGGGRLDELVRQVGQGASRGWLLADLGAERPMRPGPPPLPTRVISGLRSVSEVHETCNAIHPTS